MYTVIILFSRITSKDIFAMLKIRDRRSDFFVSRGFYFRDTVFVKIKPTHKIQNLQYCKISVLSMFAKVFMFLVFLE